MSPYENYEIADLVMDDYFRNWVFNPTEEMDEFWKQWLKLHPDRKETVRQARLLLLSIDFKRTTPADIPTDEILNRIRISISQDQRTESSQFKVTRWYAIAAVIIGLMVTVSLSLFLFREAGGKQIDIETSYDSRKEVVLPDQSVVVLNANTRLHYDKQWSESKPREVWLDGEAIFEIRKSPGKGNARFIVHTNDLDVEVLGTVFNVNSREDKTRVVLNSGKVKLSSSKTVEKEITMKPGEMAELKKGQREFTRKVVDPRIYSSWAINQLIFNQTSFSDIVNMIRNNYGYNVEAIPARIADETFTATIPGTDLDMLLDILSKTYGVTFTKSDNVIRVIDKKR